jgi:hypothetical protein
MTAKQADKTGLCHGDDPFKEFAPDPLGALPELRERNFFVTKIFVLRREADV